MSRVRKRSGRPETLGIRFVFPSRKTAWRRHRGVIFSPQEAPQNFLELTGAECTQAFGLGYPALNKFLNFWLETLEGPLHSVTVAHARLIKPADLRAIDGEFRLH